MRDEPARNRFELLVDGKYAGRADYRVRDGVVVVLHSEVDEKFRGQGLGGQLITGTLDLVRSHGDKVKLVCPFFVEYHEKHPDRYADIIVE